MNYLLRGCGSVAAVMLTLGGGGSAHGQAWIGQVVGDMVAQQQYARCMSGVPMAQTEVAEAHDPAREVMQDYWRLVSASDVADISGDFHARGRAEWVMAETVQRRSDLVRISDPVARQPGSYLQGEPHAFVRAGDGATARGVWTAMASNGLPSGFYLADFRRVAGLWKLARLEVRAAPGEVPSVTQYCARPGDVEAARARAAEREARREQRRAAREAESAAR